jgi:hypothetical protein
MPRRNRYSQGHTRRQHRPAAPGPRFAAGSGGDLDWLSAGAARGSDDNIRAEHVTNAECVDCAQRMKLASVQLHAMFIRFPGERVSIANPIGRFVDAQKVMRF